MKLDSIGALAEIGPFLGTLDRTYSLMRQLGTKTDNMWNETKQMFNQKIKSRKLITFELPLNDIKSFLESSMFLKCQKMLELFRIKSLRVTTKEQYKEFLHFIENIDFINMIEIKEFYLSVYENKDDDIKYNNIILTKEDQEPLFEQYSEVCKILKEKGSHLYNQIHSFYLISDVPEIKRKSRYHNESDTFWHSEAVRNIVIDGKNDDEYESFSNKLERIEVLNDNTTRYIYIWRKMKEINFINLLNSINAKFRTIIINKNSSENLIKNLWKIDCNSNTDFLIGSDNTSLFKCIGYDAI